VSGGTADVTFTTTRTMTMTAWSGQLTVHGSPVLTLQAVSDGAGAVLNVADALSLAAGSALTIGSTVSTTLTVVGNALSIANGASVSITGTAGIAGTLALMADIQVGDGGTLILGGTAPITVTSPAPVCGGGTVLCAIKGVGTTGTLWLRGTSVLGPAQWQ